MPSEPVQVLLEVAALLERLGIPYLGAGEFDAVQEERRRPATVSEEPPRRVWVSSPEDLILRKLDWYRAGGCVSDRQWRDVLGVLKVQSRRLDLAYLRQWGERLDLSDLRGRALSCRSDEGRPP